jgi:hypothetical protein
MTTPTLQEHTYHKNCCVNIAPLYYLTTYRNSCTFSKAIQWTDRERYDGNDVCRTIHCRLKDIFFDSWKLANFVEHGEVDKALVELSSPASSTPLTLPIVWNHSLPVLLSQFDQVQPLIIRDY